MRSNVPTGKTDSVVPTATQAQTEMQDIQAVENKVINHLTEKYGCGFECVGKSEPTFLNNIYTFTVVSREKAFDGEEFSAYYLPDTGEYRDNYWGILMRGKIDALATPLLPASAKVFSQPSAGYYPENLNRDSSPEDAAPFSVNLYVFSEEPVDMEPVKAALKEKNIRGIILFYRANGDVLSQLSYSSYSKIISQILAGKLNADEPISYFIE